jgi:hypothetical protein
MKKISLFLLLACLCASCSSQATVEVTKIVPTASPTATLPLTATSSTTPTLRPSPTPTATITASPTITDTATITPTPTFDFPDVKVHTQAHCRYGPSSAYLHAADLYPGDTGTVRGRYVNSQWLFVKFDKLTYWCWVSPSVIDVVGDISSISYTEPDLQSIGSNMYGPPENVSAVRNGDEVTISWDQKNMTEDDDRGYFLEGWLCQNGAYFWWTYSYPDQFTTTITVLDQAGCNGPSSVSIFTVEKHGYSQPFVIPWP